jgi:hypothetical protein
LGRGLIPWTGCILVTGLWAVEPPLKIHYELSLQFFPAEGQEPARVEGLNRVTITNRWDRPLGELYFRNQANSSGVSPKEGSVATIIGRVRSSHLGPVVDADKRTMRVGLFPELRPGETALVEIPFTTRVAAINHPYNPSLGSVGDSVIYTLINVFPILEYFHGDGWHTENYTPKSPPRSNLAIFDVTLTYPVNFVVGSSAKEVRTDTLSGNLLRSVYYTSRAHDVGFIVSDRFMKTLTVVGSVTVEFFTLPGQIARVSTVTQEVKEVIPFFEEKFGSCPTDRIVVGVSYSLGSPSTSFGPLLLFQQNLSGGPLLYHEIASLWFGNAIYARDPQEIWLNESFTEYASWLYQEKERLDREPGRLLKPPVPLFDFWSDLRTMSTEEWVRLLHDLFGDRSLPPIYQPGKEINWESQAQRYSRYVVGRHALQMLQASIGDSLMNRLMLTYTAENRWRVVDTETFIRTIARVVNDQVADNFRLALTTNIRPDLRVEKVTSVEQKNRQWRTVITTGYTGEWILPVDVAVFTQAGDTLILEDVQLNKTPLLTLNTHSRVVSVVLDPQKRLFDSNRFNNRWPRRLAFQPIYGIPSWETYKVYYRPRIKRDWRDTWRYGVQFSGGLGLNLMPLFPAFFQNSFDLELTFSTGFPRHNWGGVVVFRTPLKSVDLTYWELTASYEYPRYQQTLSLVTYVGEPTYLITTGVSSYQRLTTRFQHRRMVASRAEDWWEPGVAWTLDEEFIRFLYSRRHRRVLRVNGLLGRTSEEGKLQTIYRLSTALDVEKHAFRAVILRFHGEGGFVWDDRTNNFLRYQLVYKPHAWKRRESNIPLLRGMTEADNEWWNSVLSYGVSVGLETDRPVWPMVYADAALVTNVKGSLAERLRSLGKFAPTYLAMGLGLESQSLMEVGLYFPLWISHPRQGENNFALRVLLQWGFYF